MPRTRLDGDAVVVELSVVERIGSLHGDLRVPLDVVVDAEVVPDPLRRTTGVRSPGLSVPGRVKVGMWRRRGDREFVAVRRGQPAVRLRLSGHRYRSLLLGSDDPAAIVAAVPARTEH